MRIFATFPATWPYSDYWLFDSRTLVRMYFGEHDKFQSGEIVEDAAEIVWADASCRELDRRNLLGAKNVPVESAGDRQRRQHMPGTRVAAMEMSPGNHSSKEH